MKIFLPISEFRITCLPRHVRDERKTDEENLRKKYWEVEKLFSEGKAGLDMPAFLCVLYFA